MDVLLELANRLGAEGMRHDLALAGMFSSITGVEESSSDRDKCIIVFTEAISAHRSILDKVTHAFKKPLP